MSDNTTLEQKLEKLIDQLGQLTLEFKLQNQEHQQDRKQVREFIEQNKKNLDRLDSDYKRRDAILNGFLGKAGQVVFVLVVFAVLAFLNADISSIKVNG